MIALLSLYSLTLEKNMKNEWRISADIWPPFLVQNRILIFLCYKVKFYLVSVSSHVISPWFIDSGHQAHLLRLLRATARSVPLILPPPYSTPQTFTETKLRSSSSISYVVCSMHLPSIV
jgi:hypothetical protein